MSYEILFCTIYVLQGFFFHNSNYGIVGNLKILEIYFLSLIYIFVALYIKY